MNDIHEAFRLNKQQLRPGKMGREVGAPARIFLASGCPFVHMIELHEAEAPFFGPHSDAILKPGMTVCVDVSFFGHPEFNAARIETGDEIAESGAEPMSPAIDRICTGSQERVNFV